jgi:paraquat-inducible protein B
VLGGGKLWQQARHFVVVFEGSLHGLSVGAPVTFRGVPIGEVVAITPIATIREGAPAQLEIMVTLELRRGVLRDARGEMLDLGPMSDKAMGHLLDESGVRAQLTLQSVLTGQLYVDLDSYPGSPLKKADVVAPYPQLATVETGLKKLGKAIESLPIDQLASDALTVLASIDRRFNSPEVDQILASLAAAASALEHTLRRAEAQVDLLATSVRAAADATTGAMHQAEQTLAFESGMPGKVATSLVATLDQARETLSLEKGPAGEVIRTLTRAAESADHALREVRVAASEAREMLDDRSAARQGVQTLIEELAAAARSLRVLADYLERHPEALLQGKNPRR